jgi:hypothetical protein
MQPIGRYQFRVRTLLFVPTIGALSCWLAVRAVDHGEEYQQLAAAHEKEAWSWQTIAHSPISNTVADYTLGVCNARDRPATEAQQMEAKRSRERAGRLAAYHLALKRKYALAAWLPWLPLAADPAPPE